MTAHDDRELEMIDGGLAALFTADQPVPPPTFTADVLRRIQEARWRRETYLDRVFYAGLCASGILVLVGLWFALGAFAEALQPGTSTIVAPTLSAIANLSGDVALKIAIAGMVLTFGATWRQLAGQS
jgi:hypothetical protein